MYAQVWIDLGRVAVGAANRGDPEWREVGSLLGHFEFEC